MSAGSELGVGTTFRERLPAEARGEVGREAESEAEVEPGRSILVIDDDAAARDIMRLALVRDGSVIRVLQKGAYDREQLLARIRDLVTSCSTDQTSAAS